MTTLGDEIRDLMSLGHNLETATELAKEDRAKKFAAAAAGKANKYQFPMVERFYLINEIVHTDTFISSHFFISFRLCHRQYVSIDS